MLTFLLKIESAQFCIRNENVSVHHWRVDHEHYWGNYLPRLWQSFQWWKWFQETLQTIPQEKRIWLPDMWEEILYSLQSSCWRTTLDYVIQMWTVTFAIPICCKVHSIVTNKRTRRMHSNVKCVIMFTQGKTTWKSTLKTCGADIAVSYTHLRAHETLR